MGVNLVNGYFFYIQNDRCFLSISTDPELTEIIFYLANMASQLHAAMSKKFAGLRLWELLRIIFGTLLVIILSILLYLYFTSRKKSQQANNTSPLSQIPQISKNN